MEFSAGDQVRLKSGGPVMTVEQVGERLGEPMVFCVWFEKAGSRQQSQRDAFPPVVLQTAQPAGMQALRVTRG
ncbi:YodC family protein [Cupriavidus basilensis]